MEIEYDSGQPECGPLRGMLAVTLEAVEPPQKPLQTGDVGTLQLIVAGTTAEGLQIATRDVGVMRSSGDIGAVTVAGNAGGVYAGEIAGSVQVGGDVGLVRVSPVERVDLTDIREMLHALLEGQERLAADLLAIYQRQDENSRHVVVALLQALDAQQVRQDEIEAMLAPIQAVVTAIHERGVLLDDDPLRRRIEELAQALQSQASVEHKLRFVIPILPTLVEYEAEIGLGGQASLERLWERLKERFGRKRRAREDSE